MKISLILLFSCCLLFSISVIFISAQTPAEPADKRKAQIEAQTRKIKSQIEKIGRGNDITIITIDGRYHYGSILNIEDDLVFVNDVDRKEAVEIKYVTIKKVRKDYGVNRDLNGNRIPPRKNRIGVLLGTAAIAIPLILVLTQLK